MRVAVLANLKKNAPHDWDMPEDQWADLDSESTICHIMDALRQGGHETTFMEGDRTLWDNLRAWQPDICFNICEGHFGDAREAQVPAMLEMLRIPYTGSKVLTLALALDKPMTKRVLDYHDLPSPAFQVFESPDEELDPDLEFPLFVKPSREGTGMGVSPSSIVTGEADLRKELAVQLRRYREPILVERFIEGREVTLGIIGNLTRPVGRRILHGATLEQLGQGLRFLPPLEVDLAAYDVSEGGIYSHRLKVDLVDQFRYFCPALLDEGLLRELQWLAAATFRVTGCLDVARVDFRLDASDNNKPYILEINPLPGLSPGISDLVIEAEADGIDYVSLINMILDQAIRRYGIQAAQPRTVVMSASWH
jgi:D-alanine-D-alanine ligase